jgi:tripartite-type tricarboxylate transporter receptor subunit TctC
MTKLLGQTVVIENRTGASGNIGFETVAKAKPDGYTLLMASSPLAVNVSLYKKLGYDPLKDFAPISLVALQPQILVVHPSLNVKTVQELIDYAKANPGKLNYGSSGPGASQHLAAVLFTSKTGTKMVHVPYRGGGPAMTDLVAGRLQLMFETIPSAIGYIRSKQLRPLAITVKQRSPILPDLPTIAESGVPGYSASGWLAMAAPAGTPPEIIAKLSAAVTETLKKPEEKDRLTKYGLQVVGSSPEEFSKFLKDQVAFYKQLIAEAKITLN